MCVCVCVCVCVYTLVQVKHFFGFVSDMDISSARYKLVYTNTTRGVPFLMTVGLLNRNE